MGGEKLGSTTRYCKDSKACAARTPCLTRIALGMRVSILLGFTRDSGANEKSGPLEHTQFSLRLHEVKVVQRANSLSLRVTKTMILRLSMLA